jgi:drug/metabolite transporter (DMT)-like permease
MLHIIPIAFASLMAFIDTAVLAGLKYYSIDHLSYGIFVPIGMLVYSLQPLIFLESLQFESMTVMNILWDLMSDLMVTISGLLYFKEKISSLKMLGLAFAFIAIALLSFDSVYNGK